MRLKTTLALLLLLLPFYYSYSQENNKEINLGLIASSNPITGSFYVEIPLISNFSCKFGYSVPEIDKKAFDVHSLTSGINYYLIKKNYQFYLNASYYYSFENHKDISNYSEHIVGIGPGVKTNLSKRLYLQSGASLNKRISYKFSGQNFEIHDKFGLDKGIYFSIGIGIGYRFFF
ncbi:MAG: hypothetical protein K9J13_16335 [Saprospiraceae bacterium]|nr:hypothetical protein [Saprospiraceae bacterium]